MGEVAFEVILILGLILVNGILAMSEIALVSARKVRLQQRAELGDAKARSALELAQNPSLFLSTVQVGITLVGILAGAFGGATLAELLAESLNQFGLLQPYSEGIALGLVVLAITFLSLILGELVPKRLGLSNPEAIASIMARPMKILSRVTYPVVRLLNSSTEFVLRLLRIQPSQEPSITEEELKLLVREGTHAGIFDETEEDMISAIFRLTDRRIGTLITPRTEIEWLDLDDPVEANIQKIVKSPHARFPVGDGSLDNLQGILVAKDLLSCRYTDPTFRLHQCMESPVFVPKNMPALKVLEVLREDPHPSMVLVIDEFGGLQGLITANDILEAIVGDMKVTGSMTEPALFQRDDGSWLVDGLLPIDVFIEHFRVAQISVEESRLFQTLGGFVMSSLGRIPKTGDTFEWDGLHIEVADMDGLRVDKVLVIPQTARQSVRVS